MTWDDYRWQGRGPFGEQSGRGMHESREGWPQGGMGYGPGMQGGYGHGGQGAYGQGWYGQGGYGQSGYGQSGYGQAGYGQGSYGQGSYGQGGFGGGYPGYGSQGYGSQWQGPYSQGQGYGGPQGYGSQGYGGQGYGGLGYGAPSYAGSSYGYQGLGAQGYGSPGLGWGTQGGTEPSGRERFGGTGQQGRFSGRGPRNYKRSDQRIQEDVYERLSMQNEIDASDITVEVHDGVVTLSGTVEDRRAKRLAEDIAEQVLGVKDVKNELRVEHGILSGIADALTGRGEKGEGREGGRGETGGTRTEGEGRQRGRTTSGV